MNLSVEAAENPEQLSRQHPPAPLHENFPIASRLLHRRVRVQVLAFYLYARRADNIADDPTMDPKTKLDALAGFELGLMGQGGAPEACILRAALGGDAQAITQARALLGAFRQDTIGHHYATWSDLCDYCAMSASPVGRFLLGLHRESDSAALLSDHLCTALQVLNHLQDLGSDWTRMQRLYLPADWLAEAGAVSDDLSGPALTPELRRVVDRALDECDRLLLIAAPLPVAIRARGLRLQAATTLHLARRLSKKLRRQDPLARRVAPGRLDFAAAGLLAALGRGGKS